MDDTPLFSVIIPVKNEAHILARCLQSLREVDYPAQRIEVIVSDGLSRDDTREVAQRFGATVVTNQKEVVVSGRNRGFEAARGDIVVFTDADCVFDARWLKNSIKYFGDERVAGIGGITLAPLNNTSFEQAVNLIFILAGFFHSTSHRQKEKSEQKVRDIPGCNAMYRRDALAKVMPVDEGLLTAEDVWMNYCLRRLGYKLVFASDVILWHHRRNTPRGFLRQMYRFAIGRLQVAKRSATLLNPLHILTGLSLPFILALALYAYLKGGLLIFAQGLLLLLTLAILAAAAITKSLSAGLWFAGVGVFFILGWSGGFLRELIFPLKEVKGK